MCFWLFRSNLGACSTPFPPPCLCSDGFGRSRWLDPGGRLIDEGEFVRHAEGFVLNASGGDMDDIAVEGAALYRTKEVGEYYGAKATINVWSLPHMEPNQASAALIWVYNYGDHTPEHLEMIQAGWHVHPMLYNNTDTHFFVYWTADGSANTGCYNLNCPGFIFTNKSRMVPGNRLAPESTYEGSQYYITLKIYKDPQTGDWLLFSGKGDAPNFVGYWPKSLFNTLAGSASGIDLGGTATFVESGKFPPMGSGYFPNKGGSRAASFKNVQYIDDKGGAHGRTGYEMRVVNKADCFDIGPFAHTNGGWNFYFGGPGGCD